MHSGLFHLITSVCYLGVSIKWVPPKLFQTHSLRYCMKLHLIISYSIAGNIGGELNLAV